MVKKNEKGSKKSSRKNYRGLANLILMRVIPILVVIVFVIFYGIFINIKVSYSNQIVNRMNSECLSVANKVEVWSNEALAVLNTVADQVGHNYLGDNENIVAYMNECHETLISGSDGFYVIYNDEKGTTLSYDGEEYFPEYLEEDWFKFGLSAENSTFDECSYYSEDGTTEYTVTCAKNIKDVSGNVIGMTATDLKFSTIRDTVAEESKKLNASFILIDNKSGMVIASSSADYEGVTSEDVTDPFLKNLLDNFDTNINNKTIDTVNGKYVITVSGVDNTEWYLMLYESYETAYGALSRLLLMLVAAAIVVFLATSILISRTLNRQMKKLRRAANDIVEISKGNLTIKFDPSHKGPDNEITDINSNLHDYIEKMNGIISEVNTTSNELHDHARKFDELARGMNDSTITEKNALENLSLEMQNINESIKNLSNESEKLSTIAEETAASSSEAKEHMETVRTDSEETAVNLNQVTERMHIAQESMDELVSHVSNVENSAEQISSITSVIKDIASQTNLLSLNASIEAARAGEAGKGFAVVAYEIKQLAETSNENAGMIENLVSNIYDLMSKTGAATRKSAEDITTGVDVLEKIVGAYGETVDQVKATSEQINKMLENAKEVDEISGRMAEATTVQAKGTETILSSTLEIEQMVEEAQNQSQKLRDGAGNLNKISSELNEQMEFFDI